MDVKRPEGDDALAYDKTVAPAPATGERPPSAGSIAAQPTQASGALAMDDTGIDPTGQTLTPAPAGPGPAAGRDITGEPRRGDQIDHFIVVDRLGSGGMGVVLAAYDPDLDRKVAIKLLRPDLFGAGSEAARLRLLREAQAMAKLSHPNVITVHEVGMVGGRVFVAMEYVDGGTLRRRDGAARSPWRETLDRYLQAGRGLAAAHHAGLVHRDFKPDNVLVGRDGRVQVTDFGLVGMVDEARGTAAAEPRSAVAAETTSLRPSFSDLTRSGSIMGTPAYMAPEQHAGEPVDARADQFSFCVALHEGLYGVRPFAGNKYSELVASVRTGTVVPAPRDADVPGWLRAVVLRGLSAEPSRRFPTMDALLAELAYERRQSRRRRIAVVTGFAATALIAAGSVWYAATTARVPAAAPCSGTAELVAGAWDDPVRTAVSAAFDAAIPAYGPTAFARTATHLDAYRQAWIDQRTVACVATRVRGEQSEMVLDLRVFCLDGRLADLRAVTELLSRADAALVRRAVELTATLPDLAACADVKSLVSAYPLPVEPDRRERWRALRGEVARVRALRNAGRYAEAGPLAIEVVAQARALGDPPLLAYALYDLADVHRLTSDHEAAKAAFAEAAQVAATARDDVILANSYGMVQYILRDQQNRAAEAEAMQGYVDNAFARAGDRADSRGIAHTLAGGRARSAAKFDEAVGEYRKALAIYEAANVPREVAATRINIGLTLRDQGKLDDALASLGEAERALDELYGDSPLTAAARAHLGATLLMKGDLAGAATRLEAALATREAALGPHHQDVAESLTLLGIVRASQGDHARAIEMYERSLAGYRAANGPDHPNVAFPVANLGNLYLGLRDYARARDNLTEAKRIWEASLGAGHPQVAQTLTSIALCDAHLGDFAGAQAKYDRALMVLIAVNPRTAVVAGALAARAEAYFLEGRPARARAESTRAIELFTQLLGADNPQTLNARALHGRYLAATGDRAAGLAAVEAALEPARATGDDQLAGDVELELAKLLVTAPAPGDVARAHALASSADAHYIKLGPSGATPRSIVAAWRKAHPAPPAPPAPP